MVQNQKDSVKDRTNHRQQNIAKWNDDDRLFYLAFLNELPDTNFDEGKDSEDRNEISWVKFKKKNQKLLGEIFLK